MLRLIEIIWVGPKCHHKCPYKIEAVGDFTQIHREVVNGAEMAGMSHKPRNNAATRSWERPRTDPLLEPSEGA